MRKLRAQIVWQDTILFNAVLALHAAAELNAVAVKEAQVRAEQGAPLRPPATAPPLTINAGNSCWDMVARYFADDLAWAQRTTQRESGCTYAINYEGCDLSGQTDSHALGPGQICLPLHARQFEAVGCSWMQWRDPGCYFRAWRHLYDEQGRGPWGG